MLKAGRGSDALTNLFSLLESRFGRLADLVETSPKIAEVDELRAPDLQRLTRHDVCAVHVKCFYPPAAAAALAAKVARDERVKNWEISSAKGLETSDVMTVGTPFNVVLEKGPLAVAEYFDSAIPASQRLRRPAAEGAPPTLSPLDKLRLELDELWPHGATVTKNGSGRPFHAGMFRVMRGPTRHVDGFMHVDELAPMVPGRGLFSANIYLQMPPAGGELQIWPVAFKSKWDFYRHAATLSLLMAQAPGAQERLRRSFPPPLMIRPQAGDLVLISAQRPHAPEGFPIGTRVSVQSFLTVAEGKPVSLDS